MAKPLTTTSNAPSDVIGSARSPSSTSHPRFVGEALPGAGEHRRRRVDRDRLDDTRPGVEHQRGEPAVATSEIEDALGRGRQQLDQRRFAREPGREPTHPTDVLVDLRRIAPRHPESLSSLNCVVRPTRPRPQLADPRRPGTTRPSRSPTPPISPWSVSRNTSRTGGSSATTMTATIAITTTHAVDRTTGRCRNPPIATPRRTPHQETGVPPRRSPPTRRHGPARDRRPRRPRRDDDVASSAPLACRATQARRSTARRCAQIAVGVVVDVADRAVDQTATIRTAKKRLAALSSALPGVGDDQHHPGREDQRGGIHRPERACSASVNLIGRHRRRAEPELFGRVEQLAFRRARAPQRAAHDVGRSRW